MNLEWVLQKSRVLTGLPGPDGDSAAQVLFDAGIIGAPTGVAMAAYFVAQAAATSVQKTGDQTMSGQLTAPNIVLSATGLQIGDANFKVFLNSSLPTITLDAGGDNFNYNRTNNSFNFGIAGNGICSIDATGLLNIGGSGNFKLGFSSSKPRLSFTASEFIEASGASIVSAIGSTAITTVAVSGLTVVGGLVVSGIIRPGTYTVATLPSASGSGAGSRTQASDALTPTFGSTVVGGGAVSVPVYSDGTVWKVG